MAGQISADEPRFEGEEAILYLHFSAPVRAQDGQLLGVVVSRVILSFIDRLVEEDTNYAVHGSFGTLWDADGLRLSHSRQADLRFKPLVPLPADVAQTMILQKRFGITTAEYLAAAGNNWLLMERSRELLYDRNVDPYLRFQSDETQEPVQAVIAPLETKRWLYGIFVPERDTPHSLRLTDTSATSTPWR